MARIREFAFVEAFRTHNCVTDNTVVCRSCDWNEVSDGEKEVGAADRDGSGSGRC